MSSRALRLYHVLRQQGLWSAIVWIWRGVWLEVIFGRRRRRQREALETEDGFDAKYGTDTRSLLPVPQLGLPRDRAVDAVLYWPTLTRTQHRVLQRLTIDFPAFTFLDLGSGKGRAVLLASLYPFRKCIGVELSEPLHCIAQRNAEIFHPPEQRCRDIEFVRADAADFAFPPDPLVLYMFDPFGESVMKVVIQNLEQSLRAHPRPVTVIYLHARCANVLDRSQLLRLSLKGERIGPQYAAVEYDWCVYTGH